MDSETAKPEKASLVRALAELLYIEHELFAKAPHFSAEAPIPEEVRTFYEETVEYESWLTSKAKKLSELSFDASRVIGIVGEELAERSYEKTLLLRDSKIASVQDAREILQEKEGQLAAKNLVLCARGTIHERVYCRVWERSLWAKRVEEYTDGPSWFPETALSTEENAAPLVRVREIMYADTIELGAVAHLFAEAVKRVLDLLPSRSV